MLFFVDEAILPIPATAVAGAKETVSTDFDESNRLYFEELLAVDFGDLKRLLSLLDFKLGNQTSIF